MEWTKFDLHHHTYEDVGGRKQELKNYKEIIDIFYKQQGSLIVITNHNEISTKSVEEYKTYIKEKGYDINVLYGVEVSFDLETGGSNKNFGDICFIFDIDEKVAIEINEKILKNSEIYNKDKAAIEPNLYKLVNKLREMNIRFITMPHFHKGADNIEYETSKKESYFDIVTMFDLLESKYTSPGDKQSVEIAISKIKEFSGLGKAIALGTDAQNIKGFSESVKEKMPWIYSENNFKGIQHMIRFNNSRVIYGNKPASLENYIQSFTIDGETITFDRGLNSIIGRRGTGKTLLLQNIEKAIQQESDNIEFTKQKITMSDIQYIEQNELAKSIEEMVSELNKNSGYAKNTSIDSINLNKNIIDKDSVAIPLNSIINSFKKGVERSISIVKDKISTKEFEEFNKIRDAFTSIENKENYDLINSLENDIEILKKHIDETTYTQYTKSKLMQLYKELMGFVDSKESKTIKKLHKLSFLILKIKNDTNNEEQRMWSSEYEESFIDIVKNVKKLNDNQISNKSNIQKLYNLWSLYKNNEQLINIAEEKNDGIITRGYLKILKDVTFQDFLTALFQKKYNKIKNLEKVKLIDISLFKKSMRSSNALYDLFDIQYKHFINDISLDELSIGQQHEQFLKNRIDENKSILFLDQPDDDLDALTVKEEVIKKIEKWNVTKQIIVVSHDPKIVINSDSKKIILANFNGEKEFGESNYRNITKQDISKNIHKILDAEKEYPFIRYKEYGGKDGNK